MSRRPLWWPLVVLILLLAGTMAGGYAWYSDYQGEHRPDFALPAMDGGRQNIAEWDGKVVVLNFWATWCAPCRREIPILIELQKQYGSCGLQVVGIAVDSREAIRDFAAKLGINYPVLYGMEAAMDVAASYGNKRGTLPYTVVIDREGHIQHIFHKEIERSDIEPVIRRLL